METKHTKGEWTTENCSNGGLIVCLGDTKDLQSQRIQIANIANAKLIAAAPELLEALIEIIKGINPEDACYGKFAHYWPEDSNEYKIAKQKAYVGSKSIPSDEQILMAINAIKKATE